MSSAIALKNVAPRELTRTVTSNQLPDFLALCGDTLFLLVLLGSKETTLAAALGATATTCLEDVAVKPIVRAMSFRTPFLSTLPDPPATPGGGVVRVAEDEIVTLLEQGLCFCVVLRKRRDADAAFPHRISIGRAPNTDIVLRDPSISKFHGWFEADDEGTFYLADADSTNSTRVNGEVIAARERVPVAPGDMVRFGSVDALVCAPRALWTALTQLSKRAG
jgi:hypothetical protein